MLDKMKTTIVLVIIAAISGALIFAANEMTKDTIIENRIIREENLYKEIFGLESDDVITYEKLSLDGNLAEEVTVIDSDGIIIGYVYKGDERNNYGDIIVLIGVNTNGTIADVKISETTNTPNFVKKIKDDYLSPFAGQSTSNVEFDDKTGATFTYGSVSKFVEAASDYFQNRGDE